MSAPHKRRRGVLTREDLKLWAHVAAGVQPMRGKRPPVVPEEAPLAAPPPVIAPKAAEPPGKPARSAPPPPLAPLERRLRQRLSRGQRPVDGVIDLHGMRQAEAHTALLGFVARAHSNGKSLVLVITGKGGAPGAANGYDERGVLRRLVPHWLGDPVVRRHVIGFEEASREHGGGGALYVRIRRPR
jgi:DNA-nicking Smr family endonuclease